MDFCKIRTKFERNRVTVFPDFIVGKSKDLLVEGKAFKAIWNEHIGLWSTDELDVATLIDEELYKEAEKYKNSGNEVIVKSLASFSSKSWKDFKEFVKTMPTNSTQLDTKITFASTPVKRSDYISKRLPYDLEKGEPEAYNQLISTLYDPEERQKIEWSIGAIIAGDAKSIQKFLVLYGAAGAGKSTILNIIQGLFEGYHITFDAKSITNSNNAFSTEQFRTNPLVAIQHDGDLSKIEDNSKLNSIVSHENIVINEKYKAGYTSKMNCFLYMGTNKPVKITDGKSGIIRRLIDVRPSGRKLGFDTYQNIMDQIPFEYGKIANHCLEIYRSMGKSYYNKYKPVDMMYKTDIFFNYVEAYEDIFREENGTTLKQAYALYKQFCDEGCYEHKMPMHLFREELKNYFVEFKERTRIGDTQIRNYYTGFVFDKSNRYVSKPQNTEVTTWIELKEQQSIFDQECSGCIAQYGNSKELPTNKWENVSTTLNDIDTRKLHYVRVPLNHIVIDFDISKNGSKSLDENIKAATKFPKTYVETSKSGNGLHLHYIWEGDPEQLSSVYDDHIEIKVFTGKSSLRRKLSLCNNLSIAKLNSGLPIRKESKKVVNFDAVKSEKALRTLINKNLRKEIHGSTKPSIDFIFKILEDAYVDGLNYDVSDMYQDVFLFAMNSTNNSDYCMKLVDKMHFKSDNISEAQDNSEAPIVFYDTEVFPNLLLVNWKIIGEDHAVVRMINPKPIEIEELLKFRLVGFNCRRYDNHILYARMMGYTNEGLYNLSQKIINQDKDAFFGEAYNLSYADIYDFSSKKQSLKKFEIELGIHHQELGLPWDQPVPEDKWELVAEYCDNDVIATEATWNARQQDLIARKILADISGLSVNDTTRMHTTRIIFGKEKNPALVYTNLEEEFPGYEFVKFGEDGKRHNMYRGTDLGFGGYVYAQPGVYKNVALLDVASLHPHSIVAMNCFGEYTSRFKEIMDARIFIKHKEFDKAGELLNGALKPYLKDTSQAKDLAQALKIVINSVYGYTSATFPNPFKDPKNENNIVALRGALFMRTLQDEVTARGFTVAHIKTDSIKIPDATPEIIKFCMEFANKYGYEFEHEATYDRICLVNDAVYIAKYAGEEEHEFGLSTGEIIKTPWTATGTQFQIPYVFKTLFSKSEIKFEDKCETKSVSGNLYLDMNEKLKEDEHNYVFVGKVGRFCPIIEGRGGGKLMREADGKYTSATGCKDWRWLESEYVKKFNKEDDINLDYYRKLVDEAIDAINEYCVVDDFINSKEFEILPFK